MTQEAALEVINPPQEINAMGLIQTAIMQGASIDTIERLAKLQREMVEYAAKVEFNEAMHRVQSKMRRIGTNAENPQTHSQYATYSKLDAALRPIYSKEGFSLSFNTAESSADMVRVTCDVSRGGHIKTYQIDMPADGKGARGGDVMSKTHATGSATSYGMRYLLKMIFNVAIGETDDDGNGASGPTEDKPKTQRVTGKRITKVAREELLNAVIDKKISKDVWTSKLAEYKFGSSGEVTVEKLGEIRAWVEAYDAAV